MIIEQYSIARPAARAVGVDTDRWCLARFDYWECDQASLPETSWSYEVLHTSAPGGADLGASMR
jgi:hypothetical protein